MSNPSNQPIVILGGGIAGLSCANQLGDKSIILEAKNYLGGHAHSHEQDGFYFDEGAHICHSKDPDFLQLCQADDPKKNNFIDSCRVRSFWQKSWHRYPVQNHLIDLSIEHRAKALTDFVLAQSLPKDDASIKNYGDWCLSQYGNFLTDNFYKVYTEKYWRCSLDQLSTDWLSGRLLPSQIQNVINGALGLSVTQQAAFAQFKYPRNGGFASLVAPLSKNVQSKSAIQLGTKAIRLNTKQKKITTNLGSYGIHYDSLVSTIPLDKLVAITEDAPTEVVAAAQKLKYTTLLCLNLVLKEPPTLLDDHWFYIYDDDCPPSRCSIINNLQGNNGPLGYTGIQAEVFRRPDETYSLEQLEEQTLNSLGKILRFNPKTAILSTKWVKVEHSYIVSDHYRKAASETILKWFEDQQIYGLGLLGRWKYIWSDEAFRQGSSLGKELAQRYK